MTVSFLDEVALEQAVKKHFGSHIDVGQLIVQEIDVSRNVKATVFLTKKKQLYCYIHGESKMLLGDVKKIITRMGLKAELFMPPKGMATYFDDIGRAKFLETFPGREHITSRDIQFYRTLAAYHPALVLISEVKNGEIYQYDSDARTDWRIATKFAYRRIKTS